jgi:hypothetical protein
MHLSTFLEIQVSVTFLLQESKCHILASSIWKYDEFFVLSNG